MKKLLLIILISLLLGSIFAQKASGTPKAKSKPKPLVTFLELGADTCIPCKMMKPVMQEISAEYGDKISVIFYDIKKQRAMADTYKVRVMPTQVFLDKKGKEFYRHEGFFPKEEIIKLVDKKLGIKRTSASKTKAEK
jgi:thioredoxin 1